jgi:hypothetical protein
MSNVPIEIDQDALREYLEGLPVFSGAPREAKPLEMFNVSLTKWKDWELSLLGKQRGESPMVVPQMA